MSFNRKDLLSTIKTYLSHFVVALVALQVLNLGLYAQDFTTIRCDRNGDRPNIINSVTEYFAEIVMKKRDAFPEKREKSNQSDHEDAYKFQPFKIYASTSHQTIPLTAVPNRIYGGFVVEHYINHTTDITSPPPKYFV